MRSGDGELLKLQPHYDTRESAVTVSPEMHGAGSPETWSIEAYNALHASLGLPEPEPPSSVEVMRTCGFGCSSPPTVRIRLSQPEHTGGHARITTALAYSP